jgi:hypothetical protein
VVGVPAAAADPVTTGAATATAVTADAERSARRVGPAGPA